MHLLDLSFKSPEENLACDEALLDLADEGLGDETLRFWSSDTLFVTLGYSCKIAEDIHLESCRADAVPVVRRASGGGTVLQGQGCLNYSLILRMDRHETLKTLTGTNRFIMEKNAKALRGLIDLPISTRGVTDLCLGSLKFSGNAQRRKRKTILFHGTFLLSMDLRLIEKYLKPPPREPAYRENRKHSDFLTCLPLHPPEIKHALAHAWGADKISSPSPALLSAMKQLIDKRYSLAEWNEKF